MASVRDQRTILPAFPLFTPNPFLQSHREGSPAALATKPANALFFNGVLTAPDGINRLVRALFRLFEAELFAFFDISTLSARVPAHYLRSLVSSMFNPFMFNPLTLLSCDMTMHPASSSFRATFRGPLERIQRKHP